MSPKTESAFAAYEVWGLTGGIASGKSQVARFFNEEGIPVIDADQISRELSLPGGAAHALIIKRFGTDDRAKLRHIVFGDVQARKDLEAVLHPLIVAESARRMGQIAARHVGPGKVRILYEAALLVETGRYQELNGLLVVDAPLAIRRDRLIRRDGVAPELADRILAAQASDAQRLAAATSVIKNAGTLRNCVRPCRLGSWPAAGADLSPS